MFDDLMIGNNRAGNDLGGHRRIKRNGARA